ncbi:hypothetical protein BDV98DRAFT_180453 [Pterulicium gracile]|uniref:Uncharacterized protein n=1 Tax=Pterulicium gracile TaxID=1884261 RepID=A0A5C3QCX9_9AGAR|nr:hypothetical protein BDV98DRAFT_180453 [Pterula gracilis]
MVNRCGVQALPISCAQLWARVEHTHDGDDPDEEEYGMTRTVYERLAYAAEAARLALQLDRAGDKPITLTLDEYRHSQGYSGRSCCNLGIQALNRHAPKIQELQLALSKFANRSIKGLALQSLHFDGLARLRIRNVGDDWTDHNSFVNAPPSNI